MKLLMSDDEVHLVKDIKQDFHTKHGVITKVDLKKKKVKTKKGKEFQILDANFIDVYKRIKKTAAIIKLKDIGAIFAETGVDKDSVVMDAGVGSGGLTCFLAHYVKKVYAYDINETHIKCAKQNAELLKLKNVVIKEHDITKSIPKKNFDMIVIDMLNPEKTIENVYKSLNRGGVVVYYTPHITQVIDVLDSVKKINSKTQKFIHVKTAENLERRWEFDGKKARPSHHDLSHTAFLTFLRKI